MTILKSLFVSYYQLNVFICPLSICYTSILYSMQINYDSTNIALEIIMKNNSSFQVDRKSVLVLQINPTPASLSKRNLKWRCWNYKLTVI